MFTNQNPSLEILYNHYLESSSGTPERQYEKALSRCVQGLSFEQRNEIWNAVNDLNVTLERFAYLTGLRTGARLILDLLGEWEL